jgi:hypothetical protein
VRLQVSRLLPAVSNGPRSGQLAAKRGDSSNPLRGLCLASLLRFENELDPYPAVNDVKHRIGSALTACAFMLAMPLLFSHRVNAAAIDDIKVDVSREACEGLAANRKSFIVYATNSNPNQSVDADFKYDSVPAQQHFILFNASLNPITDRFPKFHARRLAPRETAPIGCTGTSRAASRPPGPLNLPIVITKQSASYVEPSAPEAPPEDASTFTAFYLQDGVDECAQGAKPPGLFYLVNLHPYARLSASIKLLDDRGSRVGAVAANLAPLTAVRAGCSNGFSKPGPITDATLEATAGAATSQPPAPPQVARSQTSEQPRENRQSEAPALALAPLSLEMTLQTQNVCAGSVPPGWIKINDAWNPTVCGKPTSTSYNVWTIQRFTDQPMGAVIHACRGSAPLGWAIVGTLWNPTVCGHPSANQPNVMAIKRLD